MNKLQKIILRNKKKTIVNKKKELTKLNNKELSSLITSFRLPNRSLFKRKNDKINYLLYFRELNNKKVGELKKQMKQKGRFKKKTLITNIIKEQKINITNIKNKLIQPFALVTPLPEDTFFNPLSQLKNLINEIENTIDPKEKIKKSLHYYKFVNKIKNISKFPKTLKDNIFELNNDVERILSIIVTKLKLQRKYVVVTITLENGRKLFYTLNNNSLKELTQKLKEGSIIITENKGFKFSDTIINFFLLEIKDIDIEFINYDTKPDKDGKFFGRINITPFDLTRYQIIKSRKDLPLLNDHCFIYALKQLKIDENQIEKIKLRISNNYLRKYDLEKIANILNKKIILHHYNCNNKKTDKNIYGKKNKDVIELVLYDAHYFIFEVVEVQRFIAKNWKRILKTCPNKKAMGKFNLISKCTKKGFEYSKTFKMSSLAFIKELDQSEGFETSGIFGEVHDILNDYNEKTYNPFLDEVEKDNKLMIDYKYDYTKNIKEEFTDIIFADCESTTKSTIHKCMAIGFNNLKGNMKCEMVTCIPEDRKELLFEQFFDYVIYKNKHKYEQNEEKKNLKFLVYFHNLKYDKSFFKNNFAVLKTIEKDNILYQFDIYYKGCRFLFRDSYKVIPAPLGKFGKMFNIKVSKDVLPYDLYDDENIYKKYESVKKALFHLKKTDHKQFLSNLKELNLYKDNTKKEFRHMAYMVKYLVLDVEVLRQAMIKQRDVFIQLTGLSIFDYLTIPSITYSYLKKEHVFDGIEELGGQTRCFVQKNVRGGRVATQHNKKWFIDSVVHGYIVDFDACSLYPSAIKRVCDDLGGFPIGKCSKLNKEQFDINILKNFNYYVVEIKILKINKHLPISFISSKIDGKTTFSNEPPKENIVVDSITLEDYINFQKIEYEIIRGVYWNNGVNKKFGERMEYLYNQRKIYKADKNIAMSNCLKLIMNSAYGKTIMKPSTSQIINKLTITNEHKEHVNKFIVQNYNRIKPSKKFEKYVEINILKSFIDHYNSCHIGGLILSMSKRIMNEVMSLGFDNDIDIFYQDTDSMHLKQKDVKKLSIIYKEKYDKELIGGNLGQFHSDFELHGAVGEVVSILCIILGKKAYLDVLQGVDENGEIINGFHVRMKGVNTAGLEQAKKIIGSYEGLYEDLYNDQTITFDLCADKFKPKFSYNDLGQVYTESQFKRSVKFDYPKGELKQ